MPTGRAWILVYVHRPGTSRSQMNRLHTQLFGFKGRSKYGKYKYEHKGLLTGRAYLNLRRGVLVLPLDMGEAARLLVEAEKATAWLRRVELSPEDETRLSGGDGGPRSVRRATSRSGKGSRKLRKR